MNKKGIVAIDKRTEKKNCGNNAQKLLPIKRRLNANKIQFKMCQNTVQEWPKRYPLITKDEYCKILSQLVVIIR